MLEQSLNISSRIRTAILNSGLSYIELEKKTGIAKSSLQRYASGNTKKIPIDAVEKIAAATGYSTSYLMGWESETDNLPSNMTPIDEMNKIPLVGRIACGTPILAEENIEDYVDLPSHIHADFALECKGDSMINAGIYDGDIVYIKKQPFVENGQIAAVLLDGEEATLKRFYKNNDTVTLLPENTAYSPMTFVGEEINSLKIEGLAVAFTHKLI